MGTEHRDTNKGLIVTPESEPVCCAAKFSALSGLFRVGAPDRDCQDTAERVSVLLAPCTQAPAHECAMFDAEVLAAGDKAASWLDHVANVATFQAEQERVFGHDCCNRGVTHVPSCAATHMEGGSEAIRADVAAIYRDLGFTSEHEGLLTPECPCHISNELDFVAHCLRLSAGGLSSAGDTANDFLSNHLFAWGIVFAAAVTAVAEHPVLRFAGVALEGLLFCEANAAFERWHSGTTTPA